MNDIQKPTIQNLIEAREHGMFDDVSAVDTSLRSLVGKAAVAVGKHKDPRSKVGIVDGDFDHHPYVQGQVDLIFEVQKQSWHEDVFEEQVVKDWIRREIKGLVFGA